MLKGGHISQFLRWIWDYNWIFKRLRDGKGNVVIF